MSFSLSEFRSSINNNGVARTNSYNVNFSTPLTLQNAGYDTRDISLRCQYVELPEIDLLTLPYYPRVIGGGERRVVGLNQYKVIRMEFIVDRNMNLVNFFNAWLQSIVNIYDSGTYTAIANDQLPYEVAYRDEYATTIDINVYPNGPDMFDLAPYTFKLLKAYPINSGNISLRYDNQNNYMVLPIGFTYESIIAPGLNTGSANDINERE